MNQLNQILKRVLGIGAVEAKEIYRLLLFDSLQENASHIHLEMNAGDLVIRYRVRGKLQQRCSVPGDCGNELFDAIKTHFGIDPLERRRPQAGRTRFQHHDTERLLRVDFVTASQGATAVLNWEQLDTRCRPLTELGLLERQRFQVEELLQLKCGVMVIAGLGNAGKRTFGHALLMAAHSRGKATVSLEWGVTRSPPGIPQCDFYADARLSQRQLIEAALRRQPDVVFIEHPGNVDTIDCVMKAARNQCLVIASIGKPRDLLIDYLEWLAVPRASAVEAVAGVIEQRLLPVVCSHCAHPYSAHVAELEELRIACHQPARLRFARDRGCAECRSTAAEKVGVHQVVPLIERLRDPDLPPATADGRHLCDDASVTFHQSAIEKLIQQRVSSAAVYYCLGTPKHRTQVDLESGSVTPEPACM